MRRKTPAARRRFLEVGRCRASCGHGIRASLRSRL
jgi:hypothetical protein